MSQKYAIPARYVPDLRRALGADETAVQEAYQQRTGRSIESAFTPHVTLRQRLRWRWARLACRLENMPPFWTAFSLTVTETVGASILALPIALAGVGPIAGVVLLIVLGFVNIITIAGIVEAITRNGNMRYGSSYFGRLVGDTLGSVGSFTFTLMLLLLNLLVLPAFYIGIGATLSAATGAPDVFWVALVFLAGLYFLRRESLDATIASALVVGIVNIGIIILLCLLALPHVQVERLLYVNVPFINGRPFDPGILGLIFGVVLASYFGHTSAGNAAKVVLRQDPSGRSLLWGNVAALGVAGVLYCLWVVIVNGAIDPHVLAGESGTALGPLAAQVGPVIHLFGSIFVILGMGMVSIHLSLGLFNQVREWLPATAPAAGSQIKQALLNRNGRFWLAMTPGILIFLVTEWIIITGRASFTGLLSFLGMITIPTLGGIFPMLMLFASRRKGDYVPQVAWRILGNPIVVAVVYLIFLTSVIVHGAVIWQAPLERAAALGVAVYLVIVTAIFFWQGAFRSRTVLEVRLMEGASNQGVIQATTFGKSHILPFWLTYDQKEEHQETAVVDLSEPDQLRAVHVEIPAGAARELKVWAYRVTREGACENLPLRLVVQNGRRAEYDLAHTGYIIHPLLPEKCQVDITFHEEIKNAR